MFGLIDKGYSSYLRRKFNLEQEGTVNLADCLLMNTDKKAVKNSNNSMKIK